MSLLLSKVPIVRGFVAALLSTLLRGIFVINLCKPCNGLRTTVLFFCKFKVKL